MNVVGSFNGWSKDANPLADEHNGFRSAEVADAKPGDEYRYVIVHEGVELLPWRPDPYARAMRTSVGNSVVHDPAFDWGSTPFRMPGWDELVIALGAQNVLIADRVSHAVAFAGLGAAVAAVVVRAVGCGDLGAGTLLKAVAALSAGAVTGAATSLAVTGLTTSQALFPHVLVELLVCTAAGSALLVLLVDGLRLRPARRSRSVVFAGAVGAGLLASAAFALGFAVVSGATAFVGENLALLFVNDLVTFTISLVVAAIAVLLVARTAGALRVGLLAGLAAGAIATAGMVTLLLNTIPFADDDAAWRYYLYAVWAGIALATAAGAVVSVL